MKCPKCDYLGFDTGDRCKNCGYDFSLLADAAPLPLDPDVSFREPAMHTPGTDAWLDQLDRSLANDAPAASGTSPIDDRFDISLTPAEIETGSPPAGIEQAPEPSIIAPLRSSIHAVPATAARAEVALPVEPAEEPAPLMAAPAPAPALPLFTPVDADDDRPLITVPRAPRPPLSVRRTPETPRLRAVPKPLPRPEPPAEPVLAFGDEPEPPEYDRDIVRPPRLTSEPRPVSRVWRGPATNGQPGPPWRRLLAALIDHAILGSIDLAVVYFTLRMVSLDLASWGQLPLAPLGAFLLLIKLAYFCAFTAVGGQTIGKMAARIRVVTDAEGELDGAQAVRRTLFGVLSTVTFGLGFLPGLFGDGRALHDRAARTRVVGLEPA